MKIHNRQELYEYLRKEGSQYYLIKFDDHIEPIYFFPYEGSYFESPCVLSRFPMKEDELEDYVHELYDEKYYEHGLAYEKTMQIGDMHYDLDCPQCTPFLPDELEIIKPMTEEECLHWIIDNWKEE